MESPTKKTKKYLAKSYTHLIVPDFKRRDLARLFYEKGFFRGAEIGVCHGTYSKVLCDEIPGVSLISVDPYRRVYNDYRSDKLELNNEYEALFDHATKLLEPYPNCRIVREESLDAVRDVPYESLDFVYIDGSHEFDYVITDIVEWAKRVKPGGIIAGHDYIQDKFKCDVIDAVNAYVKAHGIKDLKLTDERTSSWWFTRK